MQELSGIQEGSDLDYCFQNGTGASAVPVPKCPIPVRIHT